MCGLILQQKLFVQLRCQFYNRRAMGVSVYSAAKQTHVVLIKKSVNIVPFQPCLEQPPSDFK